MVSVSEKLVSKKSLSFGKFGLGRKVSVSVSEKFGIVKKVSVSVSVKILVSSFSGVWGRFQQRAENRLDRLIQED